MKTLWITIFFGLAVIVSLGGPGAYAQFEIDPDHFETREREALPRSKADTAAQRAKIHYAGNFTLPYTLECNHQSLLPGKYSPSVDSDGSTAQVTLNQKGRAVKFQGIVQRQNRYRWREVLVVERNGGVYHLSAIHLAQLDLTFNAYPEHQSDGKPRNFEKVALILAKPRQ